MELDQDRPARHFCLHQQFTDLLSLNMSLLQRDQRDIKYHLIVIRIRLQAYGFQSGNDAADGFPVFANKIQALLIVSAIFAIVCFSASDFEPPTEIGGSAFGLSRIQVRSATLSNLSG